MLVANPPAEVSFNPVAAAAATAQETQVIAADSRQVSSQRSRSDETGDEVLSPALIDTLLALDDLFSCVEI